MKSILSDDDFPGEQEEEVFDLTRLTFHQFSFKIRQEKRKSLAQSHPAISTVATEKDIVLDTRNNPVMIASAGTAFSAATEENVTRMSREIISLQNRLKAAEQEKSILESEVRQLQSKPSQVNEVPMAVMKECDVLEITMRQVYREMLTLK